MGGALSDRDSAGAASSVAKHAADGDGRRNDDDAVGSDRGSAGLDQLAAAGPEDARADPAQGALFFLALARAGQAAEEGLRRHEAPLGATAATTAATASVCHRHGQHVPPCATAPTTAAAAT